MNEKEFISTRFPYIPITIAIRTREETIEALLDTGFDGEIILPPGLLTNGTRRTVICAGPWLMDLRFLPLPTLAESKLRILET